MDIQLTCTALHASWLFHSVRPDVFWQFANELPGIGYAGFYELYRLRAHRSHGYHWHRFWLLASDVKASFT